MDRKRIFVVDNKRLAYLLVFVVMFIITEIGRNIYRPYVYSHGIFDFWIADTIGNFTGSIAIVFFDFTGVNPARRQGRLFLLLIILGLNVYELLQYFSPRSVLDWRDMVATAIAGLISWGIYELLWKYVGEEEGTDEEKAPT